MNTYLTVCHVKMCQFEIAPDGRDCAHDGRIFSANENQAKHPRQKCIQDENLRLVFASLKS